MTPAAASSGDLLVRVARLAQHLGRVLADVGRRARVERPLAVERDGQRRQRQVRRCGGGRAAGGSRAPRSAATPRRRGRPRPARPGRPRRSVGRARPPRRLCAAVPRAAPQARRGCATRSGSYGNEDRRRAREARPRCRSLGTAGRCRPRSSARRPAWRTPGTARPSGSAFRRASGSSRPRGSRRGGTRRSRSPSRTATRRRRSLRRCARARAAPPALPAPPTSRFPGR